MIRLRRSASTTTLFACLIAVLCSGVGAAVLTGRVLRVDGNGRLVIADRGGAQYTVALAGIRLPALGEPFGKAAVDLLLRRVAGRFAVIAWNGRPAGPVRYGVVRVADRDVALDLLLAGLARIDPEQADRLDPPLRRRYEQAEREARSQRRGLWGRPAPRASPARPDPPGTSPPR